jgi:hypothetical protein
MKHPFFRRYISVIFLCNAHVVLAGENVCKNKHWLQSPVIASTSHNGAGIGGTGFSMPIKSSESAQLNGEGESGIGGTGVAIPTQSDTLVKKEDESGIGGTGIVGIISGFGSICVDGVEIHVKETTPIFEDGVATPSSHLALGQTVSVLTHIEADNYFAKEIRVLHEVSGEVKKIDTVNNTFSVLGQTVHLPADLIQQITLGGHVNISGNRLNDGSIEALRVDKSDKPIEKLSLIGPLEKETASGNFHIGKQIIDIPAGQTALQIGDEVRVQGTLKDKILYADSIEHNPRWAFSSRVDQILLQGHIRDGGVAHFNIDGIHVIVNNSENQTPQTGQYVGVWVHPSERGTMILNHWQEIAWSEHSHAHHIDTFPALFKEEKLGHESSSVEKKTDPLRPALIERPDVEKHESNKIDIDRPNIEKMELNKPGIERPEIEKLETSKPDIDRPEVEKFEINHPDIDRPDTNHTDIDKPTLLHLDIHRPDLDHPHH